MRFVFLLLAWHAFASTPEGQFHLSTYKAGYDIHFSPYAGGENILFLQRGLERIEGRCIAKTPMVYSPSVSARFYRFIEWMFFWLPANYFEAVVQHECFGHGYRIRDINRGRIHVKGYTFGTPIPYGDGGGSTYYSVSDSLTTTEESAVAAAGVEASTILAQLTKLKWMEARFIDPRQIALYLLTQFDLSLYINSLRVVDEEDLSGHDIYAYLRSVNYTYTDGNLTKKQLLSLSWVDLADPFSFMAAYGIFRYILFAKETPLPYYLPGAHLGLTPFGPEIFIDNYLICQKRIFSFYVKGFCHAHNRYGGFGIYAPQVLQINRWRFGLRLDGWRQPKLLLTPVVPFSTIHFDTPPDADAPLYPYSSQHDMRLGASCSILIAYHGRSGFETELGYKSAGFLPGYSLRASPVARLFYTWFF